MTVDEYYLLSIKQKNDFIEMINNQINNHRKETHYEVYHRKRKTSGQIKLKTHQPTPGRLFAVDELKRTDVKSNKIYVLCLCDCGKWHICRSDAYNKGISDDGCASESIGEQMVRK